MTATVTDHPPWCELDSAGDHADQDGWHVMGRNTGDVGAAPQRPPSRPAQVPRAFPNGDGTEHQVTLSPQSAAALAHDLTVLTAAAGEMVVIAGIPATIEYTAG